MNFGQRLTQWWQNYATGGLKAPGDLFAAALNENPDAAQAGDRFFSIPDDQGFSAPERLKASGFFNSPSALRQYDKADWQNADPRLQRWAALYIELARKRGVPLYVHCAFRTEAEQVTAFNAGHSKTRYPHSAHNTAQAVDIVHGVFQWDLTRSEWAYLDVLARLALDRLNSTLDKPRKLSLVWGGSWSFYDPAHYEITDYRGRIARLPVGSPVRKTPRGILASVKLPDPPKTPVIPSKS